jgi:cytoskeletal protein CcmA (bactofilin family)
MTTLGKTISVKGELRVLEDLTVEGRVEGPVWCENRAVTIASSAHVVGDVIARDITVFGRIAGQLLATDVVDVRAEATVTGRVVSKRFILNDGPRLLILSRLLHQCSGRFDTCLCGCPPA